jgi:PAS domain S-box-containing protein
MLVVSAIRDITARVEKDAALRESEERYRSLLNDVLDSSSVAVCILDDKFQVVWVNRAFESYFDLPRREVVGFDARRIVDERLRYIFEEPKEFHDKIFAAYDNNTYVEHFECHVLPENGRKELWLEHWSQPITSGLYSGGRIEHYTDVTERKEADTRIRFFGRIARNMQIGLLVYRMDDRDDDHSLRIVAVNPEGQNLLGIPQEDLLDKKIDEAFPSVRETGLPRLLAEVNRSGEARTHQDFHYGDNRVLENVWSFKAFPLPDHCVGVVFEKITDRVRADELVQNIAAGVAGATGEEFFRSLVVHLVKSLGLNFAFVGELADEEKTKVQTVVMCDGEDVIENVLYDLHGTPCANVTAGAVCCHPEGVRARFPEDKWLQDMGIESYLGTPLVDSSGTPIGLMSVMGQQPLANPETATAVLRIFASRAAVELERRRARALKSG